jgi:hypothetical protein
VLFGSLLCDACSVTRLHSANDRVTSEWWWWTDKDKHPCFKQDSNPVSASKQSRPMSQTAQPLGPASNVVNGNKEAESDLPYHNIVTVMHCLVKVLFKIGFYYTQISAIYNWLQLTAL